PGGAVWADAAVIIPWTLYRFSGDVDLLGESYAMMRDYVETLIEKDRASGGAHILRSGFTFGDWLALDGINEQAFKGGTDDCYILSVYYWNSVHLCEKAAKELGMCEDTARYGRLCADIREAILDEFFAPSGRLCIDTQTGYVLALYFGLYRDKEVLLQGFCSRIKRDSYRMKTGFCGTPLLLPALLQNDMTEEAFRFLYNESFPGWLYCVNLGATTIWERWNSILPDGTISGTGMNSLNHYAYGSVAEALYGDIAGLRCGEHGWKTAIVAPRINYRMRYIRVSYDSPCGRYASEWRRGTDGLITLEVTIPASARARIIPPYHPDNKIFDEGPGHFSITYQPTVDLLHPWSSDSLLADLMADPAASKLIQEKIPALYQALSFEESALLYDSLASVAKMLPMIDERQLPQLDAQLRTIIHH
ncbi:MAG: alpha-L-rhamnosidase C-terminal domain-containing protein, partial [Clostridia bacterium]